MLPTEASCGVRLTRCTVMATVSSGTRIRASWHSRNSAIHGPSFLRILSSSLSRRYRGIITSYGLRSKADDDGQTYEVAPDVLKEHGKTKNPYPNVDAASGGSLS